MLASFLQRWFVDGSVKCFTGGHLPLAIVAILVLMFYILLMIFVTATVLKKIKVAQICLATYFNQFYICTMHSSNIIMLQ